MPNTIWSLRIPIDPDMFWRVKRRALDLGCTLQGYVLQLVLKDMELAKSEDRGDD